MSDGSVWTVEDLAALETAIGQGVKKVEYNDRTVEYRTLNEMLKIRELMKRSLGLHKRGGRLLCGASKGTV